MNRTWTSEAIAKIDADFNRSADTHLIRVPLTGIPDVHLYLKDESTHPTGSLKHRLARSLFLYALCNGEIGPETTVVEASSGSTAISEAYFAKLLGLRFIAVIPHHTAKQKIALIESYGGTCQLVEGADVYAEAKRLSQELNGHYMDQFTYAERATDWRGNNNIAESIFSQMSKEPHPIPDWVVAAAGTGGTSATIGRYARYAGLHTQICVPDPENSVFAEYHATGNSHLTSQRGSRIEGIGRPRVEPSFIASVVDRVIQVPDAASMAGIRLLESLINRRCGGSTGTNMYTALLLAAEMKAANRAGSIVTLICDSGDRYLDTYYNDAWLKKENLNLEPFLNQLTAIAQTEK